GVVWEVYRVGAAALRGHALLVEVPGVLEPEVEGLGAEDGGAFVADQLDALGKAGIGHGRRVDRADRAIGEGDRRAGDVLGVDGAQRRGGRRGGDRGDRTSQAVEQ